MTKRNAARLGIGPHSAESVAFTVQRYGAIKEETLKEIVDWLETPETKAERVYEIVYKSILDSVSKEIIKFPVIKTHMIGSAVGEFIDNERDAQNTLANIRNLKFPENKQGQ